MKPIATAKGIAFALPDVCNTPAGGAMAPVPYPNVADLSQASPVADDVVVGPAGDPALLASSVVDASSGDEAGSGGGVKSGGQKGACEIVQASGSVVYGPDAIGLVRFGDATSQNDGNADGFVLSTFPSVLVGD